MFLHVLYVYMPSHSFLALAIPAAMPHFSSSAAGASLASPYARPAMVASPEPTGF